jgi:hypothetical protein
LMNTNAVKIIENQEGVALVRNIMQLVAGPQMIPPPVPAPAPAPPPQQPQPQPQPQQPQRIGLLRRIALAIRFVLTGSA